MHIVITGSSGFVGVHLIDFFMDKGYSVTAVDAGPLPRHIEKKVSRFIQADTTVQGSWQDAVRDAEIVINLTGKNIFHRWSDKYKRMIYDSRILSTRNIVAALPRKKPVTLISTSAAGYYGSCGDEILNENMPAGDDFLARVCIDWEKEAFSACEQNTRVVCMRFGVVLGGNGGALSKMLPAYMLFVGGPLGDGRQWFPWIQMADLAHAVEFVINNDKISGPVNFCSPNPVRNNEFSRTLGNVLNRPSFFRTPAFLLKLAAGELGGVLLSSQRAVPERLLTEGYSFKYPNLDAALQASLP